MGLYEIPLQSDCVGHAVCGSIVYRSDFPLGRCALFLVVLLCGASSRHSLPLPESARTVLEKISDQCPECLEQGFSPTGTDKIGFGKRFFPHFFLGNPGVGILVTHIMTGEAYKRLLHERNLEEARRMLREAFEKTRLVVIEKNGHRVHVSGSPEDVTVVLTKKLHQCLYGSAKKLCCCCTASCEAECCEKGLGSTYTRMRWKDPLASGQFIEYTFYPHLGESRVFHIDASGKRKDLRWCLDSQQPGFLK